MGWKWERVLNRERRYSVEQADVLEFLRSLPDDSIDLLVTSPPYEDQRDYEGQGTVLKGEDWVRWMFGLVEVAAKKVKGPIIINCEGKTEDFSYSATPFLLLADLKRAGYTLRKPGVYRRWGVAGSGGPDWLRNCWEPILVITRPGRLPWSDNTAEGGPPKYKPGGDFSNRRADGGRVKRAYTPPERTNPGNVIDVGANTHLGAGNKGEAPFAEDLPRRFVLSCCPPDGLVCDPFVGTGTTAKVALQHGRRFIGCDLRQSQVSLSMERIVGTTPSLFADLDPLAGDDPTVDRASAVCDIPEV